MIEGWGEPFSLASLQAAGSPAKALNEMTEGEQDRALLSVAQPLNSGSTDQTRPHPRPWARRRLPGSPSP
jgi:hypothetical protein